MSETVDICGFVNTLKNFGSSVSFRNFFISQCDFDTFVGISEIFDLLFNSAELSKFAPKERKEYIKEMTTERDRANQLAFAERKGQERGLEQGLEQVAKTMLAKGYSVSDVSECTGLPTEVISKLREL